MIEIKTLKTFKTILSDIESYKISYRLYGHKEEVLTGSYALSNERPKNNKIEIKLVVMSTIGTFYLHEFIKLEDEEPIVEATSFFREHDLIETDISFKQDKIIFV